MVMLLRSRGSGGRRKKSSGLLGKVGGAIGQLLGGSKSRSTSRSVRGGSGGLAAMVPGWIAIGLALLCFGSGYVVRGYVAPPAPADGGAGLQANSRSDGNPVAPGVIEVDTAPLANQAFFVAAYDQLGPEEAKSRAVALSRWLRDMGLKKAKPYRFTSDKGTFWFVVVYYYGQREYQDTRQQLLNLPQDPPDPVFVAVKQNEPNWPPPFDIQR